jgi:Skp family chaperone for outer membrane proteins
MIDAATLIDQLDEFEETDSGLWEGQSFKEAIGTCATFTYGNAVMSEWHDLIERINEEAESIIDEYDGQIADLEAEIDDLETLADAADTEAGQEQRDEIERKRGDLESLQAKKKAALEKLIAETADAA